MTTSSLETYQQYRVPRSPGSSLVEPVIDEQLELLTQPGTRFTTPEWEFCGQSLEEVRRQARIEALQLARDYSEQYLGSQVAWQWTPEESEQRPIVLSGHQPELFHAGVWFKNFLLAKLAQSSKAVSINFLVDNDLCRTTSIRVPTRDASGQWVGRSVAFDTPQSPLPWELRGLQSMETWQAFPEKVTELLQKNHAPNGGWQPPLLAELWPAATQALERTGRVGAALAQARHQLEVREGLHNLEVPLSHWVSTRAFARFSIGLLAELPRFQDVYNRQRDQYRAAHGIRNDAHPVPALEQDGRWLEAPWWVYRATAPERRRLWVQVLDDQLLFSDRAGWQAAIAGRLDCDQAASQWLDLLAQGVCLRPRALLTTMYLRLIIADFFVHGIGGGKYDQLTNGILVDFFGIEAPPMAVATATLRLPAAAAAQLPESTDLQVALQELEQQQWALKYHAEQFAEELPIEAAELVQEKQRLLDNIPPKGEKWEWHQSISQVNRRLQALAGDRISAARSQALELKSELRQTQVVESREYSFALFPKQSIVPQLKRLSGLG